MRFTPPYPPAPGRGPCRLSAQEVRRRRGPAADPRRRPWWRPPWGRKRYRENPPTLPLKRRPSRWTSCVHRQALRLDDTQGRVSRGRDGTHPMPISSDPWPPAGRYRPFRASCRCSWRGCASRSPAAAAAGERARLDPADLCERVRVILNNGEVLDEVRHTGRSHGHAGVVRRIGRIIRVGHWVGAQHPRRDSSFLMAQI